MAPETQTESTCVAVEVKVGIITIGGLYVPENDVEKIQGSKSVILGKMQKVDTADCEDKPVRLRLNGQVLPVVLLADPRFFVEVERLKEAKKIVRIRQADGCLAISEKLS